MRLVDIFWLAVVRHATTIRYRDGVGGPCPHTIHSMGKRGHDPVSIGKYGYERISSDLAPVVRIMGTVSMDWSLTKWPG